MAVFLDLLKAYLAADFTDNGQMLGLTAFKQLLNTRQDPGNILRTGDTAGMERSHGQLGTGFTDGLGGDDTDRLAHGNRLAVCQVGTVALLADAMLGAAVEDRTDLLMAPRHAPKQ